MLKTFKLSSEDLVASYKKKLFENKPMEKLTICKKCYTFYYENSWHFEIPPRLKEHSEEEVTLLFSECTACSMEEEAAYDNEVNSVLDYQSI